VPSSVSPVRVNGEQALHNFLPELRITISHHFDKAFAISFLAFTRVLIANSRHQCVGQRSARLHQNSSICIHRQRQALFAPLRRRLSSVEAPSTTFWHCEGCRATLRKGAPGVRDATNRPGSIVAGSRPRAPMHQTFDCQKLSLQPRRGNAAASYRGRPRFFC